MLSVLLPILFNFIGHHIKRSFCSAWWMLANCFFLWFFYVQVSNEEAKSVENSKLQKMLESLNLELDAAKLATINECNKNAVLQNQLELSLKEKSALERELIAMAELRKENALLRVSIMFCWIIFFLCDLFSSGSNSIVILFILYCCPSRIFVIFALEKGLIHYDRLLIVIHMFRWNATCK